MSKDKISDYSATANSNTDIGGINIDEGCAPSGINDAIRTLMKQIKDWQSGSQDVYIHPTGSASAPSVTATGDTNTGLFFPAADTIALTTGGTERLRLDSAGNLGLGVTPSAWGTGSSVRALQFNSGSLWNFSNTAVYLGHNYYFNGTNRLYSNTGPAAEYQLYNGTHAWNIAGSGSAGAVVTFNQAMTLDASGNLGVGTTSPSVRLDVSSASGRVAQINSTSVGGVGFALQNSGADQLLLGAYKWVFGTGNAGDSCVYANTLLAFGTNGSERARIDSSGNLLVGRTSGFPSTSSFGCYFGADGTLNSSRNVNGTSAVAQIFGNAGEFRVYGNGTYATISDARIKENVVDATPKLQDLMGVRIVNYNIIGDDQKQLGVIAQELSEVFPALVDNGESEDDTKAVRYSVFVPMLIKAIQELKTELDAAQARITALEA